MNENISRLNDVLYFIAVKGAHACKKIIFCDKKLYIDKFEFSQGK
jgi:hypothetical protein